VTSIHGLLLVSKTRPSPSHFQLNLIKESIDHIPRTKGYQATYNQVLAGSLSYIPHNMKMVNC